MAAAHTLTAQRVVGSIIADIFLCKGDISSRLYRDIVYASGDDILSSSPMVVIVFD
jgi:hypothetical protein